GQKPSVTASCPLHSHPSTFPQVKPRSTAGVLALTAAVGTLAGAMGVLALAGAVAAAGLGITARRRRIGAAPETVQQMTG
ncbi:hypothetical protein ACFYM3_21090, partial [Streptomyces massasporeus]